MNELVVRGARQHNLKDVSCRIPRDQLVVITGPSGSGKSSLAFDTIYAEGQRRYVESLSAYARQFLEQLGKPAVESIEGLSPAIAIEQRALARSPRSTVGTVTEIADYLRLAFARAGRPHCPKCGKPIEAQTVPQMVDLVLQLGEGTRVTLLAPVARARRGELKLELERLRRDGFVRARLDGELVDLGDVLVLDGKKSHDLDVVIDRVVVRGGVEGRLSDSIELALRQGEGRLLVDTGDGKPFWLSEHFACTECSVSLPPIEPRMFSFNGPNGACPECDGLGTTTIVDPDRLVPDPRRSLREGALAPWGKRGSVELALAVDRAVKALGIDPDTPWSELSQSDRELLLYGDRSSPDAASSDATQSSSPRAKRGRAKSAQPYEPLVPKLERALLEGRGLEAASVEGDDTDDSDEADDLGRYSTTRVCPGCDGKRLRSEALAVRLGGSNIAELGALPLRKLRDRLVALERDADAMTPRERAIATPLLRAIIARLGFLIDVGLDYLELDRPAATLSGGEGQRIRLATQIGAALVGVLYVLDEPSVGLHPRDHARLLDALRRLVDVGNSVLVVEHDRESILAADHVIDIGPGAGVHGGRIVAQGTPADIVASTDSLTGAYLRGERSVVSSAPRTAPSEAWLEIVGARLHNLKNVDVAIPVGLMTAVTGVSGSGKSSLVSDTLLPAARRALYRSSASIGACTEVRGLEHFDKIVSIDQAPIGRTPRSNPATYTGLFTYLRELFAGLPEARARGYKPGRFSFNVKGGRCEACAGDGLLRIEMHFLPDVFVPCDSCGGCRYSRETLEVRYRGQSIAEVLELTVEQALVELESVPRIRELLAALERVGLGYLQLGQSATTLSGGEAQRVKLARELARRSTGRTLYVLDEPTTGLHFSDIEQLLGALSSLRDAGNTIVVVEHDLDVVASSDWVIDLGPEGGEAGGEIVGVGTPEEVSRIGGSHTGRYLRDVLSRSTSSASRAAELSSRAPSPGTKPAPTNERLAPTATPASKRPSRAKKGTAR